MSEIVDLTAAERRMQGAVEAVRREFATIRTGRANPALLDRVEVEVYGTRMQLRSVANVGVARKCAVTDLVWLTSMCVGLVLPEMQPDQ